MPPSADSADPADPAGAPRDPPARDPFALAPRAALALALGGLARTTSLVVPRACWACRAPAPGEHPLCPACRREVRFLRGALCSRCGLPVPCGRPCPASGSVVARAWAPVVFEGPARALVHALKFRGALGVADLMAAQMVAAAPPGLLDAPATLVPVPTHPLRRRARGFDQAERLAAAMAARTGLPIARCLGRSGAPSRQAGASRAARRAAGRIDIRVRGDPPRSAILVDDVHTTGATLEACAVALRRAAVGPVYAVAYARALR